VPGLGDIPLVGRLFSSHGDDKRKTEIILSITPHIIRNIHRPDADVAKFWSGTDDNLRNKPLSLQAVGTVRTGTPSASATQQRAQPVTTAQPASGSAQTLQPDPVAVVALAPSASLQAVAPPATLVPGRLAPGVKLATAPMMLSWQGTSQAKVGDQFKLSVYAQTGGKVVGIPFKVNYDASALEVVDVSEGDFLKANNAQTVFSSNVNQSGGQVAVDVSQPGLEGSGGRGSLAALTFKVTAANPGTPITVTASAVNAAGDAVPVTLPAPRTVVLLP
jgi:general secretion pathway protein D